MELQEADCIVNAKHGTPLLSRSEESFLILDTAIPATSRERSGTIDNIIRLKRRCSYIAQGKVTPSATPQGYPAEKAAVSWYRPLRDARAHDSLQFSEVSPQVIHISGEGSN